VEPASAEAEPLVGRALRRLEDARLLRGAGRYSDDVPMGEALWAVFFRSPYAHARVVRLSAEAARSAPGVAAVLTAADLRAAGVGPIPFFSTIQAPNGAAVSVPPCHGLVETTVRHVGEPLACVLAESEAAARDAAEAIELEAEPLPSVVEAEDAIAPGAPCLWEDCPDNVAGLYDVGDAAACAAALEAAEQIVTLRLVNNRIVVHPMEPRSAHAHYDPATGRWLLQGGSQAAHLSRDLLARALGVAAERLDLVVPDVGGGFGARIVPYREELVLLVAARTTGRPARWRAERSEAFLSDTQGRDQVATVTLGVDGAGRIQAYRADILANLGATLSPFGLPIVSTTGHRVITGPYDIPTVHLRLRGVLTNSVPTGPYRGAGRPETIHRLERVIDLAARRLGLDPEEMRRRNLLRPDQLPYRNAAGWTYDSGDFPAVMDAALDAADWSGFAARKAASAAAGRLRGRGIACHIDTTSGVSLEEEARLVVDAAGDVTLFSGTQAIGQGLATAYAQIVAERLGVPPERVIVVQGDTRSVRQGGGTYGSRSLYLGGSGAAAAATRLAERLLELGAEALEAARDDLVLTTGRVAVAGTDRAIALSDLAGRQTDGLVRAEAKVEAPYCFPNGCCIAEAEVEPETGRVRVERLTTVDDVGRVINPLLVEGQMHGGLVQGLGQAVLEACRYDPQSGQLLSGSLMDYALPRADEIPAMSCRHDQRWPTATNPLGAKGAGESGALGAPPAIVAAVVDALAPFGIEHLDMPLTAERVWRAMGALD